MCPIKKYCGTLCKCCKSVPFLAFCLVLLCIKTALVAGLLARALEGKECECEEDMPF